MRELFTAGNQRCYKYYMRVKEDTALYTAQMSVEEAHTRIMKISDRRGGREENESEDQISLASFEKIHKQYCSKKLQLFVRGRVNAIRYDAKQYTTHGVRGALRPRRNTRPRRSTGREGAYRPRRIGDSSRFLSGLPFYTYNAQNRQPFLSVSPAYKTDSRFCRFHRLTKPTTVSVGFVGLLQNRQPFLSVSSARN